MNLEEAKLKRQYMREAFTIRINDEIHLGDNTFRVVNGSNPEEKQLTVTEIGENPLYPKADHLKWAIFLDQNGNYYLGWCQFDLKFAKLYQA